MLVLFVLNYCFLLASALLAVMSDDLQGRCSPLPFVSSLHAVPQAAAACEILQSQKRACLVIVFS